MKTPLPVAIMLLAASLMLGTSRVSDDAELRLLDRAFNILGRHSARALFADDSRITPYKVGEKWVYLVPIRDRDGSRCTNNFDARWDGQRKFEFYVVRPKVEKDSVVLKFQRKGDKSWASDSNRGPVFEHRDDVVIEGTKNYLAQRKFDAADLVRDDKRPCVVFIEKGLSLDDWVKDLDKKYRDE